MLKPLMIVAVMTSALAGAPALGADNAPDQAVEEATALGSASGTVVVGEAGEGVDAEGLEAADAFVLVRGLPEISPNPYPPHLRGASREELEAWRESDEGKAVLAARAEAINNVHQAVVPVSEDGGFTLEGLAPGRYNVIAFIPHPDADVHAHRRIMRLSHAAVLARLAIPDDAGHVELGEITMQPQNVLMPGDEAPDWTAQTYDGGEIKLSDFRGQYVLIDFWATWCGPCKAEIPNLEAVYADFGGERFEIIGLSLDRDIQLPHAFHEENPSVYRHGYLGEWNRGETTARAYGVQGIPSIWLIGPDGTVVARDLRGEALREAVRQAVED